MAFTRIINVGGDETVIEENRRIAEYHIDCADDRNALKAQAKDADRLIYKDWWMVDKDTRIALGGSQVMIFSKDRNDWCPLSNPAYCE